VFGGGYEENEPIKFDKQAGRVVFTSTADWKHQAVLKKTDNSQKVVDTFNERQK
jgi:hypothetical protein